jgi:DNA-binding HxlR family transcriptional regulator
VEYTATERARELYDHLVGLTAWAERHRDGIAAAQAEYDRAEHAEPSTPSRTRPR